MERTIFILKNQKNKKIKKTKKNKKKQKKRTKKIISSMCIFWAGVSDILGCGVRFVCFIPQLIA